MNGLYPDPEKVVEAALRQFLSGAEFGEVVNREMMHSVWSPHEAYKAASVLSDFLEKEKSSRR